jgi:hypothetical protein
MTKWRTVFLCRLILIRWVMHPVWQYDGGVAPVPSCWEYRCDLFCENYRRLAAYHPPRSGSLRWRIPRLEGTIELALFCAISGIGPKAFGRSVAAVRLGSESRCLGRRAVRWGLDACAFGVWVRAIGWSALLSLILSNRLGLLSHRLGSEARRLGLEMVRLGSEPKNIVD